MKRLNDLSNEEARAHFLKGSSYFNGDMPRYISVDRITKDQVDMRGENICAGNEVGASPGVRSQGEWRLLDRRLSER